MKKDLLWAILPEGLEEYFDVESFEKDEEKFSIVLVEKSVLPAEMPAEYHGKKVINTVLNDMAMDDFPIRGRKCEIILRRRWWKFEGVDRMLMRSIDIFHPGMSIDEVALSQGELYTVITNKEAHGRKGALAALIKGTKNEGNSDLSGMPMETARSNFWRVPGIFFLSLQPGGRRARKNGRRFCLKSILN